MIKAEIKSDETNLAARANVMLSGAYINGISGNFIQITSVTSAHVHTT